MCGGGCIIVKLILLHEINTYIVQLEEFKIMLRTHTRAQPHLYMNQFEYGHVRVYYSIIAELFFR